MEGQNNGEGEEADQTQNTHKWQAQVMAISQSLGPFGNLLIGLKIVPGVSAVVVLEPPALGVGGFADHDGRDGKVEFAHRETVAAERLFKLWTRSDDLAVTQSSATRKHDAVTRRAASGDTVVWRK